VRIAGAVCFLREAWEKLETKVIEPRWGINEDELNLAPEDDDEDTDWKEKYEEQTK
jgi:hypothetical protein